MSDNKSQIVFDSVEQMECPSCHAQVDVHAFPAFSNAICPSCRATLSVPGRLGSFLLLNCLGSGGMGSVYRALDQALARIVAVKVMLKSLGDQPEFVASFQREAQAAARLNHPNIAQVYSFGQEKGQPYIVMELVPGKHFDEMIAGPDFLDQALVMKIGMDIADGLQLAASSNLIHGDIKPENILLDDRGVAKLVDFGIASAPGKGGSGEIWGTPYYIAPEKLRRQRVDYRSDIYCLGGTLYHALTKHPPFDGEDAMAVVKARLEGPPAPMATYRPDISPEISEIIDRMLQLEPAMRYPTYGSLISDMRRYLSHAQPPSASSLIGANKRIVFKGRGRGKTSQVISPGATSSLSSTGRHPLVISRGTVDPKQSQQITASLAGAGAPRRHDDPGDEPDRQGGRAAKVTAGFGVAAAALVLLAALAGAGVFFSMRKKAGERSGDWAAGRRDGEAIVEEIGKTLAELEQTRDTVVRDYAVQANGVVSQALAAVEGELGADAALRGRIQEEPAALATAAATNAPAAPPPLDGLPLLARGVFLSLQPVRDADRALIRAIGATRALSRDAGDSLRQALGEDRGDGALFKDKEAFGAAIKSLRETLDGLDAKRRAAAAENDAARAMIDELPKALRDAKAKLAGLAGETARLAKERAKAAAEDAARLQAEKEAAEKAAAEDAARQLERDELAKLESVMADATEAMREHRYGDVLRALGDSGDMRSDAARKRLKVLERRAERLADLHGFLVERISAKPVEIKFKLNGAAFRWLVSEADKRGIMVSNSGGDPVRVPWAKIGPAQIVPLIRHYLEDPANARKLKLIQRTDQQVNAAVYYAVFGAGNASAIRSAKALAEKAADDRPTIREEADELLAEFLEDAGGPEAADDDDGGGE